MCRKFALIIVSLLMAFMTLVVQPAPAVAATMSITTPEKTAHLKNPDGVLQISETQFFADCKVLTPYLLRGDVRTCMDQVKKLVEKGYGPLNSLTPVMDAADTDRVAGFMMNLREEPRTEEVATVTIESGKTVFGSFRQVVPRLPLVTSRN